MNDPSQQRSPGGTSSAAKEPKDEASRISKQIGDANAAAAAGFRARGGQTDAGAGAPRTGPGVR
jgi:hypothetical protein